ncbi:MAG TPA: monovalent cation/H(+) antiporter subunit G [Microthrixaceae bacterium]|nr:monovalent cation/H(+) antiporter subunit G [Microthrixaceae bacterium]
MRVVVDVASGALMLLGAGFVLLAGAGLHRFDDVFSRIHAATKAVTFGVLLVAAGGALQLTTAADVVRLVLAAGLQLVSSPVGSHILARAAYHSGTELSPATRIDQLADPDDTIDGQLDAG